MRVKKKDGQKSPPFVLIALFLGLRYGSALRRIDRAIRAAGAILSGTGTGHSHDDAAVGLAAERICRYPAYALQLRMDDAALVDVHRL